MLGRQAEQSIPQADKSGVHGHATALCSKKDVPFVLDWNFVPDQDKGDQIVFSNPHSLFAPERIDRAIKNLRSGYFLKHLFRKKDNDERWTPRSPDKITGQAKPWRFALCCTVAGELAIISLYF